VLAVAVAAGLVARHRWPVPTLAATLAIAAVVIGADDATGAISLPALIIVYTLAQRGDRSRPLALAALAALVLALARGLLQRHGWSDGRTVAEPVLALAALFLGWAVRSHRDYITEIEDRARSADQTRDEVARLIARELHDVIAHTIAMISIQAGVGAHVIEEQPERAAEALRTIKQTSKEALRELRSILGVLRRDEADARGPDPGLDQLDVLVSTTIEAGIPTEVVVGGARAPLPASVDLAAYRIVQESLTNVLRHAGPAAACVSLAYRPDVLMVVVEDDGRGDAPRGAEAASAVHDRNGHGIPGMRERVHALGGELETGPKDGGGFRVRATLPIPVRS
jgi:signal transduction histidine kinase